MGFKPICGTGTKFTPANEEKYTGEEEGIISKATKLDWIVKLKRLGNVLEKQKQQ